MSIPVVIFTFSCDHACTVFAARSALDAGLGPVFVEVDAANPLPPATTDELRRLGCRVAETTFPRNGNIRGMESMKGLLASYLKVFEATGATHLVKLDADTMILDAGRLKQAAADDVSCAALSHGGTPFYGMCMVIASRLTHTMGTIARSSGQFAEFDNRNFYEDIVIGTMSQRLRLGETRQWPFDAAGGFGAGYLYTRAKDSFEEYARKYDVITFGNRHLIPGDGSPCAKRDKVAETMLEFQKILDRKRHGKP
jgi:hypothetical protein